MPSVVVIGAGLAGLSSAWRLQRAGFDVQVLEAQEEVGGRLRTEDVDGFRIEPGIASFASHDRSLHSLARHLGLSSNVRSVTRFPDAIERRGRIAAIQPLEDPLFLRADAVSTMESLRLLRLRIEWMRWRRELDFGPLQTTGAAGVSTAYARLDAESLATYLDRIVGTELRRSLIAPLASLALGLDAENISAAHLLGLIHRVAGARPQYMTEGLDQLTNRLASRISVRTRCEVTSLETQPDGARVRYRAGPREGSVVADSVVVALPGTRVLGICPKLTPSERGFFEDVRYARSIDAHVLLNEPCDLPYRSIALPRRRGRGLYGVQVCDVKSGVVPAGAGMLRASVSEAASERLWHASDPEIAAFVVEALAKTPVGEVTPRRTIVNRCDAMTPVFYAGSLAKVARFNARMDRTPRLAFCGDYLAGNGAEAALTSGMRAASQIAHGLA